MAGNRSPRPGGVRPHLVTVRSHLGVGRACPRHGRHAATKARRDADSGHGPRAPTRDPAFAAGAARRSPRRARRAHDLDAPSRGRTAREPTEADAPHPHAASHLDDAEFVGLFLDEGRTGSKLRHRNIVAVDDLGAECKKTGRPDFEAKFSAVHDAFHGVMESSAPK